MEYSQYRSKNLIPLSTWRLFRDRSSPGGRAGRCVGIKSKEAFGMATTVVLGFIAATCSTIAFLPQVIKTWRTRSTADISLGMFAIIVTGNILWIAYGWLQNDLPLLMTNAVIFFLAAIILYFKLRYR
jgi:MtN3 and saliva related transmembrane protein